MNDYFDFKKMVSSTLIKVIYFLGLLGIVIAGIVMIAGAIKGISSDSGFSNVSGWLGLLSGVGVLTLGNLAFRLLCEGIIVLFSIHENLTRINKNFSIVKDKIISNEPLTSSKSSLIQDGIEKIKCPKCNYIHNVEIESGKLKNKKIGCQKCGYEITDDNMVFAD